MIAALAVAAYVWFVPPAAAGSQAAGAQAPAAVQKSDVVAAVGCLTRSGESWILTKAGMPAPTRGTSSSAEELKSAEAAPLGDRSYSLVGLGIFQPAAHVDHKVWIKGGAFARADGTLAINVTSLQSVKTTCSP